MTQHFLIRSKPNDRMKLQQSFVLARQQAQSNAQLITLLLPMVNQVSSLGLDQVLGKDGVKSLNDKRKFMSNGITYQLKSDKTIKNNETNGIVLALACSTATLNKLVDATKTDVIIAVSFKPNELEEWAASVKAVSR